MTNNNNLVYYSYRFIQVKSPSPDDACDKIFLYSFVSAKTKLKYIVRVEKFPCEVYVPKFYLKNHASSSRKYILLTKTREPRNIIHTCMKIMFDILDKNELASVAFVGAKNEDEDSCCKGSKRWRVYSRLMKTYVSDEKFTHLDAKEINAYLVLNKNQINTDENFKTKVRKMFIERINVDDLV